MKRKNAQMVIIAALIIGIIPGVFISRPGTDGAYYNAVLVPSDPGTIYAQEVKLDTVAATISISKVETPDFLPEQYRLIVHLC